MTTKTATPTLPQLLSTAPPDRKYNSQSPMGYSDWEKKAETYFTLGSVPFPQWTEKTRIWSLLFPMKGGLTVEENPLLHFEYYVRTLGYSLQSSHKFVVLLQGFFRRGFTLHDLVHLSNAEIICKDTKSTIPERLRIRALVAFRQYLKEGGIEV